MASFNKSQIIELIFNRATVIRTLSLELFQSPYLAQNCLNVIEKNPIFALRSLHFGNQHAPHLR